MLIAANHYSYSYTLLRIFFFFFKFIFRENASINEMNSRALAEVLVGSIFGSRSQEALKQQISALDNLISHCESVFVFYLYTY